MDFSNFYTLVLTIAIIILILLLGYIGWLMSEQKTVDEFPKLRTSCPDYWKVQSDENGKVYCVRPDDGGLNRGDDGWAENAIGVVENIKFDTTDPGWASAGNTVCGKQKWANKNGISWDTVTNANFC